MAAFVAAGCDCGGAHKSDDAGTDSGQEEVTRDASAASDAGSGGVDASEVDASSSGDVDAGEVDASTAEDAGSIEEDAGLADAAVDDAGQPDGGEVADAGAADAADICSVGTAASYASNANPNLFGQVVYYADGGVLPAGKYSVQYVDGCMKYAPSQGWTIHAYANGSIAWWLVGSTTSQRIVMPPGTVGIFPPPSDTAFQTFDECVAENLKLSAKEFDFEGGMLGLWVADSNYPDNVVGTDGRNPKWELKMVSGCDAGLPPNLSHGAPSSP